MKRAVAVVLWLARLPQIYEFVGSYHIVLMGSYRERSL